MNDTQQNLRTEAQELPSLKEKIMDNGVSRLRRKQVERAAVERCWGAPV